MIFNDVISVCYVMIFDYLMSVCNVIIFNNVMLEYYVMLINNVIAIKDKFYPYKRKWFVKCVIKDV